MSNVDFTLYSIPTLISRNKSKEYQKSIIRAATALFHFMDDNQLLVNIRPFDETGNLNIDIVVKVSNVTDDGFKLFKNKVISGWHDYLDRSTAPDKYENISRLEKGLAKIRDK
ncbi:hypothetical protein V2I52_23785 [Brenneria sp. g21c3]|uniref:hypothetical protein n=1 Tax=Brenneria sp. g21c3 TaxID=3093893 RepID=UPI002EB4FBD0|nr:hypothetical protein [Brenneria sp. g21c3]